MTRRNVIAAAASMCLVIAGCGISNDSSPRDIPPSQQVNLGLTLTLSSGDAIENVIGGALNDTLTGNSLNNVLTGGAGNDTYVFNTDLALGSDTINEAGGGIDTLDFSATTTRAVAVDLSNAAAQVVNAGLTLTLSSGTTMENATAQLRAVVDPTNE